MAPSYPLPKGVIMFAHPRRRPPAAWMPQVEALEGRDAPAVTQLTAAPFDHRWPSNNNQGDYVYSAQVGGLWQVFRNGVQVTSNGNNNMFPSISDGGDIVYFQDGGSPQGGVGWQVVRRSAAGAESTVEFSSRNRLSGAHRDAHRYTGIASNGTSVTGFDFFSSSFGTPTRRFNVGGVGQLPFDFGGSFSPYSYPDVNAQGDLLFAGAGTFNSGNIYKTSAAGPFPGARVASGTMGRINDAGDVVTVSGNLTSPSTVRILTGPGYAESFVVGSGSWADINNKKEVVFEGLDAQGRRQVYLFRPEDVDVDMQTAQLVGGNIVQFTYQTTGNPGPFLVGLYRSADGVNYNLSDWVGSPQFFTSAAPGQPSSGSIPLPTSLPPDLAKPYIMVVADPFDAVTEVSGDNNTASVQLPELAPTSLEPLHGSGGSVA